MHRPARRRRPRAGLPSRHRARAGLGLDFIPLTWESYDITLGGAALGAARPIITALRDRAVRASILRLQGYDLDHAGALTALN